MGHVMVNDQAGMRVRRAAAERSAGRRMQIGTVTIPTRGGCLTKHQPR